MTSPEPEPLVVSCDVYEGPWPQAWRAWTTIAATFGGRAASVLLGSPPPESVDAAIKAVTDAFDEAGNLGTGEPLPVTLTLSGNGMELRCRVGRSWAWLGVLVRGPDAWGLGVVAVGTSRARATTTDAWTP